MKHLKPYENMNKLKIKSGNFVIWKDDDEIYYEIIQITRTEKTILKYKYWSKLIYIYKNNNLITKNNTSEQFFTDSDYMAIKYISNNIEDCIKMVNILADSNKFNL